MTNRIVSEKEFRDDFRRHAETVCDFSQKKNRHILGVGSRQMNIDVGVEIIDAMIAAFDGAGRTLDRKMVELHTPKETPLRLKPARPDGTGGSGSRRQRHRIPLENLRDSHHRR